MPSPRSSILVSMEMRNPIRTIVISCACHIIRALSRAKSFLVKTARKKLDMFHIHFFLPTKYDRNKRIYFGSFRFHYNWGSSSSSDLKPLPAMKLGGNKSTRYMYYYDSTLDSVISMEAAEDSSTRDYSSQLSKYLEWLEDQKSHGEESHNSGATAAHEGCMNEIDKLADMFIAKCHEMFILEKQESERRFQEMIAI